MAELGPSLKKMIDSPNHPPWLRAALTSAFEGGPNDWARGAFTVIAFTDGYGRLTSHELPTDQRALPVITDPNNAFWNSTTQRRQGHDRVVAESQAWLKKAGIHSTYTLGPLEAIAKIPVLGPVIKAAASPITTVAHLAEGQSIGQAALDNFKSQVGAIKAVGPYAATIVSFVPGIGTGFAAAIAAGTALAEGKPIDEALEAGIKGAIPGGAIAASGYELAKRVASGENVGKAALEAARAQLPAEAQKAFDIGLAVVTGKQLQQALAAGIANLAPDAVKQIFDIGAHVVQTTPGLSQISKTLSSDAARQGLQLASGALAHAGINETQIRAMRKGLTGDVLKGFDTALQAQAKHFPWLDGIATQPAASAAPNTQQQELVELAALTPEQQRQLTDLAALSQLTPDQQKQLVAYAQASKASPKPPEPAKTAPKPSEPTRAAPAAAPKPAAKPPEPTRGAPAGVRYPPYPKMGAVHGAPGALAGPAPHCAVWGAPVPMDRTMLWAARSALISSKGRPAVARAPGGTLYMFTAENGAITARPCVSGA